MLRVSTKPAPPHVWTTRNFQCMPHIKFTTRADARLVLLDDSSNRSNAPVPADLLDPQPRVVIFEIEPTSNGDENHSLALEPPLGLVLTGLSALHARLLTLPVAMRRLLAGGIAGAIGKTATAPLEAVKLQLVQGNINAWGAAHKLYSRGGVGAFFRGNGLDVLRTMPAKGIELATFDALKRFFLKQIHNDRNERIFAISDDFVAACAGALAGIVSTVCVHPLETVRTRMAVMPGNSVRSGYAKGGALSCAVDLVQRGGLRALFRGLDASVLGVIPYAAIRLATYDGLKRAYKKKTGDEHITPQAALVFGAVAGVVSAVATFPLEVARRRLMAGGVRGNTATALVHIVRREGPGALFAGVWLMVLKQAPQYALGFAAYEQAKRALAL